MFFYAVQAAERSRCSQLVEAADGFFIRRSDGWKVLYERRAVAARLLEACQSRLGKYGRPGDQGIRFHENLLCEETTQKEYQ